MSRTAESELSTVKITVVQADALPELEWRPWRPSYCAKVTLNGTTKATSPSKGSTPKWDEALFFSGDDTSNIVIEVHEKHNKLDVLVGTVEEQISHLRNTSLSDEDIVRELTLTKSRAGKSTVTFRVSFDKSPREAAELANAVTAATQASERIQSTPAAVETVSSALGILDTVTDKGQSAYDTFQPFLDNIKIFVEAVDGIAQIHPYANAAWKLLRTTYDVFAAQMERDKNVKELSDTLGNMYKFVLAAGYLEKVDTLKDILALLSKQTLECSYWIRDYTKRTFVGGIGRNIFTNIDSNAITQYQQAFESLKKDFVNQATVHSTIIVMRVLSKMDYTATAIELNDLPYAGGMRFVAEYGCLPSTRTGILQDIFDWANVDGPHSDSQVILLTGLAGSGKSAIAHTIANRFKELNRLGSSFFCSRTKPENSRPEKIFSTIATDIADLDPHFKSKFGEVIKDNRSLRKTVSPREQFDSFIRQPMKGIAPVGPVLVVIDALDECDGDGRSEMLEILSTRLSELPSNVRVLLTARDGDSDIQNAFAACRYMWHKRMQDIDPDSTKQDITAFIQASLNGIPTLDKKWPDGEWCHLLVEKAGGLFIWASTACLFIRGSRKADISPTKRLEKLLSGDANAGSLDWLYLEVLDDLVASTAVEEFRSVLGRILAVRIPLSVKALEDLSADDDDYETGDFIQSLGSLLTGTTDSDSPLQPLHASFADFLVDPQRSGHFCVDLKTSNADLAKFCLRIMTSALSYDICRFGDIFTQYSDVIELPSRISGNMSQALQYSCRYWVLHLQDAIVDDTVSEMIRVLLLNHLLHWIEALSLMQEIDSAVKMLYDLGSWLAKCMPGDSDLLTMTRDGIRFVTTFVMPISRGPLHVYVSALPFTPINSLLYRTYIAHALASYPNILAGKEQEWPSLIALGRHTANINHLMFSPDGKVIASGSADGTVRLWDAKMGGSLSAPLKGDSTAVLHVAFSLDSAYVAGSTSDRTVRIWEVKTGVLVSKPLVLDSDVYSIAFSPDGRRLAAGLDVGSVQLWDIQTCTLDFEVSARHAEHVESLAFSTHQPLLASGSRDFAIRIWNSNSGAVAGYPLEGHEDWVLSVEFSRNGLWVASMDFAGIAMLWDVQTRHAIHRFLPRMAFNSIICFSPDETHLASPCISTVQLWDVKTGEPSGEPRENSPVTSVASVALSPNCTQIAYGMPDGAIGLWDTSIVDAEADEIKRATAAFSAERRQIALGLYDGSIELYDSRTGLVTGHLSQGSDYAVRKLEYSPTGRRLATMSETTMMLWDLENNVRIGKIWDIELAETTVKYSSDGARFGLTFGEGKLYIVDSETGVQCAVIEGLLEPHVFAFSLDRKQLASALPDGRLGIFDSDTGMVLFEPLTGPECRPESLVFSPDGAWVGTLSGYRTAEVWRTSVGSTGRVLEGQEGRIYSICFSPDGVSVATISSKGHLQFWNVETGQAAGAALATRIRIYPFAQIAFSPTGDYVACASFGVQVWNLRTGKTAERVLQGSGRIIKAALLRDPAIFEGILAELEWEGIRPHSELPRPKRHLIDYPSGVTDEGWVQTLTGRLLWHLPSRYRVAGSWDSTHGDLVSLLVEDHTSTVVLFQKVDQYL